MRKNQMNWGRRIRVCFYPWGGCLESVPVRNVPRADADPFTHKTLRTAPLVSIQCPSQCVSRRCTPLTSKGSVEDEEKIGELLRRSGQSHRQTDSWAVTCCPGVRPSTWRQLRVPDRSTFNGLGAAPLLSFFQHVEIPTIPSHPTR